MKTIIFFSIGLVLLISTSLTSCKKERCTDSRADNYDTDAKKRDDISCTYTLRYEVINTTGLSVVIDYTGANCGQYCYANSTWTETVTIRKTNVNNEIIIGELSVSSLTFGSAAVGSKVTATIYLKDGSICNTSTDEKTSTSDTDPATKVQCK